jgi:hypothetical protein
MEFISNTCSLAGACSSPYRSRWSRRSSSSHLASLTSSYGPDNLRNDNPQTKWKISKGSSTEARDEFLDIGAYLRHTMSHFLCSSSLVVVPCYNHNILDSTSSCVDILRCVLLYCVGLNPGLVDGRCLISYIKLINRKAELYRLFYQPGIPRCIFTRMLCNLINYLLVDTNCSGHI